MTPRASRTVILGLGVLLWYVIAFVVGFVLGSRVL